MRGDVLGLERRRRRWDEDKVRIVAFVGAGDVTVTQLAHHHEVTRQQIYAWRPELKKNSLLPSLQDRRACDAGYTGRPALKSAFDWFRPLCRNGIAVCGWSRDFIDNIPEGRNGCFRPKD